jgi:1,3-beta-glucanosyltransferase GAS1
MPAIYGSQMTPVLSGAIVYEWTEETNDYGIISYPANGTQDGLTVPVGSPVPIQPDFNNLMSQWSTNIPSGTSMAAYTPSLSTIACPASTSGTWPVDPNGALPGTPSKENPTPGTSASTTATGTSASSGSSGTSASARASGKSLGTKVTGNEGVGAWFAFLAACVALGCLV